MKSHDISVVLTLYKRPEILEKQLIAIEQQTVKPREIIIFQDKVAGGEPVIFPENLRKRFDLIEISDFNHGVWGRFYFARKARSPYICLFDDDTIPGKRWLENCITQMEQQEGIYGTNGILMLKPSLYPQKIISIGWKTANPRRTEVDFVGHSWFFKKEWLEVLFQAPQTLQDLKICGEDMAFSYQCYHKMGIKTFVPPHPFNNKDFFGSLPETGYELGGSAVALSLNPQNIQKYNVAMRILLDLGWNTYFKRNPLQFYFIYIGRKISQIIPHKGLKNRLRKLILLIL